MEQINESEAAARQENGAPRKKRRSRAPLVFFTLAVLLAAAYAGLCAYASGGDFIFPGVTVYGQELGSLTRTQAEELLAAGPQPPDDTAVGEFRITDPEDPSALIPHAETVTDLTFGELGGVTLDAAASAQAAWDFCHDGSFLRSGWSYLMCLVGQGQLDPILTAPQLDGAIAPLTERLTLAPLDTAYDLSGETLTVTAPRNGYTVDPAVLADVLREALTANDYASISCPGTVLPAQVMTAEDIHNAVTGEMRNARYDTASHSILPERPGADFDLEAAQAQLDSAEPGAVLSIPATIHLPKITAEELEAVLFRDVLGQCTTPVRGSAARKNNVRLSSSAINGVVLNSGDVFSYNGTVGKRTAAKGYQAAPAYVKGETVDEIGGGVCQPSSTLYLACLRSNLQITERYAHRYLPAYIPAGMDATVSWGGPDYKFTNNTDYPIKIVTSYTNGQLTIKLLGTNVDGTYAKITNEHLSTTPWQIVYEEDPTLAPGTEQVKTTPYTGHKYNTYRTVYDRNGNRISSDFEASSNYKARNKVILRGPALDPNAPPVDPNAPVQQPGAPIVVPTQPAP